MRSPLRCLAAPAIWLLLLLAPAEARAACGLLELYDGDDDGLCTIWEGGCSSSSNPGQSTDSDNPDSDGDYIRDDLEVGDVEVPDSALNTDNDGAIDGCDTDSDNDGLSDQLESGCTGLCTTVRDSDDDGTPDYRDTDSDNDFVPDEDEGQGDADRDDIPNYLDPDDDEDGLTCEAKPGIDTKPYAPDTDQDFIPDGIEVGSCDDPIDSDGDRTLDAHDTDSDNDGLSDKTESGCSSYCTDPRDTDQDGLEDFRDTDSDDDGAEDDEDNCLLTANPDQEDADRDGDGDTCDDDRDGDDVDNLADNCPDVRNPGQEDQDEDSTGDVCDADRDGDGIANTSDNCPYTPNADQANRDDDDQGDVCDTDLDNDGIEDLLDNCPADANKEQADQDSDETGDVCDPEKDGDGWDNEIDNCPDEPNPGQENYDGDEFGDVCDSGDSDGDTIPDLADNCLPVPNEDQSDLDKDGLGDVCDDERDGDGVENDEDNCPDDANADQLDTDDDEAGNACDEDDDEDGLPDTADNCPLDDRIDQTDTDGDDRGDVCDPDDDDDTVLDEDDNCPLTTSLDQDDQDGDGRGDVCDEDRDGDGVPNEEEAPYGLEEDPVNYPVAAGGGCDVGSRRDGPAGGALWLAGLGLALVRRRRAAGSRRTDLLAGGLALLALLPAPSLEAQTGFDVELLRPTSLGRGGVAVSATDVLPPASFQVDALAGYNRAPLVLRDLEGEVLTGVVDQVSSLNMRLAFGLPFRTEAALQVPLVLQRGGPETFAVSGAGPGDMGLELKMAFLDRRTRPVGLAVKAAGYFPSGARDQFSGDGGFGVSLEAGVDRQLGPVLLATQVGARWRPAGSFRGAEVGPQLLYGLVAGYALPFRFPLELIGEVHGALALDGAASGSPSEALLSILTRAGPFLFQAGGGAGLNSAVGSPEWRAFLAMAYTFDRKDRDDDRVTDSSDRCPDEPEDVDGHQDRDGCPDPDNDGDGHPDGSDRCPNQAEDRDGHEDGDGCPDDDNDGDGLTDASDRCPNKAEDLDRFQDEDGCPDEDNDGDGVADDRDRCPDAAETHNGFQDDDGCADTPPVYVFRRGERLVFNNIQFATGRYELLPASFPVLDDIVTSLQAQPQVRLRVEGHTDDRGVDRENLVLSQQRALAIVNYLVGAGIDKRRLDYAGYGETRPIAPNDSEPNRAKNRRVEFVTLDETLELPGGSQGPGQ